MVLEPSPLAEGGLGEGGGDVSAAARPVTPLALAAFFALATAITAAVCVTMIWPGGPLDVIWRLKPYEHEHLMLLRPASTAGFVVICAVMAATAVGALFRKRWGWTLAVGVFGVQAIGDAARMLSGAWASGLFGLAIVVAILWWLARRPVRDLFA